jgi:hypothetical protein
VTITKYGSDPDPFQSATATLAAASSPEKLTEHVEAAARGEAGPDRATRPRRGVSSANMGGASHPARFACSSVPPSRPAGVASGAAAPATAAAVPGTAGVCEGPGGGAVVQRSVHDRASLQYQRMSAHAWPPSGTSRPSGSAMPHMEHWATSSGRSRSRRAGAGGSASARRGPARGCSGPVPGDTLVTDETCGAMIPPRGTPVTSPPALGTKPGTAAGDVDRRLAHTKPAHSGRFAHTKPARGWPSSLIPSPRIHGSHPCPGGSRQTRKSFGSRASR